MIPQLDSCCTPHTTTTIKNDQDAPKQLIRQNSSHATH
jgi:hypothetical protein